MRAKFISQIVLLMLSPGFALVGKGESPAKTPTFSVPPAGKSDEATGFSGAQLAFVQSWIKQKAPECPSDSSAAAAQQFLEELQRRYPEKLDQLVSKDFPVREFESMLLRSVATKMTGAAQVPAREEIARRRIGALLLAGGKDAKVAGAEDTLLMEKIKDGSQTQYRRLLEGRMDDDDLQLLLKKMSQNAEPKKEFTSAKPKVLTAADIVAEFSRRNQVGSAMQRLQAYVVEGRIKPATGEPQDILLFRMRPDCFRLVVQSNAATHYILAASAGRYWQHSPGKTPQTVPVKALGERRYLTEFADPLFTDDFTFERLEDGSLDGNKFYRISVRRSDGSRYVARIDPENFREVGRENEDKSTARYSDFREVGGVIYAFREELTDNTGRTGVFELTRVSPNPGLIQDFFEPPARPELGYYELEGYLAPTLSTAMKFN